MSRLSAKFFYACIFTLGILNVSSAHADSFGRLDIMAGFYSLTAETASAQVSLSRVGVYKVGFRRAILPSVEFGAGYSLFASQIITGDMGYGPDLGLYFYPFTDASATVYKSEKMEVLLDEVWRPFVWGGFHQRSFQSINASYAGFSGGAGSDYRLSNDFGLRGEFRYMMLSGPEESKATQIDFLLGITFSL